MNTAFKALSFLLGIIVLAHAVLNVGTIWQIAFGMALLISPVTAFSGLFYFMLMLLIVAGFPIIGAIIGAEMLGKGFGVAVGLAAGICVSFFAIKHWTSKA